MTAGRTAAGVGGTGDAAGLWIRQGPHIRILRTPSAARARCATCDAWAGPARRTEDCAARADADGRGHTTRSHP